MARPTSQHPPPLSDATYRNLTGRSLVAHSIRRQDGQLSADGALVVRTGAHTGRAAGDKFIVREASCEAHVDWDANKSISEMNYFKLKKRVEAHLQAAEVFVQDASVGARQQLPLRVLTTSPSHALFCQHLFRERIDKSPQKPLLILHVPELRVDPGEFGLASDTFIVMHLSRRVVLIGGTYYAGEIKKSAFSFMNYVLPGEGILPMHAAVNTSQTESEPSSAIFFGLSGTGKTTLSADTSRVLVGDDEHGWDDEGLFNFEGGCYAKTIRLSKTAEPDIWAAVHRSQTLLENVILDENRTPDLDDASLAENTRAAYPLAAISNASDTGTAQHPDHIFLLTADAYGVLPPIARLSEAQAMYYFLSGYTAKVAGTERGVTEPTPVFSACFGAPFMPRNPVAYAELLGARIRKHQPMVWLLNTGWVGGAYGTGERISIQHTRALLHAALSGVLNDAQVHPGIYGLAVPGEVPGVPSTILRPRDLWADGRAYDKQAQKLAAGFEKNFDRFTGKVIDEVRAAGPRVLS